jgi:hypothetical protein
MKGVSAEDMALRPDLVAALHHRIHSIPVPEGGGGEGGAVGQNGARTGIQFDSSGFRFLFCFLPAMLHYIPASEMVVQACLSCFGAFFSYQ